MFKKIFLIFIFIGLTNCGFVPINNINNKNNISIQSIKVIGGDRKLNIALQRNLKRYQQNISENPFKITIDSSYQKKTVSKDTTGAATKYQLKATANFEIEYNGLKDTVTYEETFNIDRTSDDFENRSYENTVKENFANSISQKLIFKLLSIQ